MQACQGGREGEEPRMTFLQLDGKRDMVVVDSGMHDP